MRVSPGAACDLTADHPGGRPALEARIDNQFRAATCCPRLRHSESLTRDGHSARA